MLSEANELQITRNCMWKPPYMHIWDIGFSCKDPPVCEVLLNTCNLTKCGFTQTANKRMWGRGKRECISKNKNDIKANLPLSHRYIPSHKLRVDYLPSTYCVLFLNFLIKCLSPRKFCRKDWICIQIIDMSKHKILGFGILTKSVIHDLH